MAKYKIGITEAGDAGLDLSWEDKLDSVDGAILITKRLSHEFFDAVLRHKDKVIVHATVTGYGKTVVEPNVPTSGWQLGSASALVKCGFPKEQIVIRVDPIIPTTKGCVRACNVMRTAILLGFNRFRISLIDMYPHVRERFSEAGLPIPYDGKFSPSKEDYGNVNAVVLACKMLYQGLLRPAKELRIEACAEPGLFTDDRIGVIQCGCISAYDLALLGLDADDADQAGHQRKNCLCYSGKVELLQTKQQCPHKCLYCYWRQEMHSNHKYTPA